MTAPRNWLIVFLLSLAVLGCNPPEQQTGTPGEGGSSAEPATGQQLTIGKYVILDTRTDLADRARAKQNVEDTLTLYPDVDCLVGLWSYNTPAILSALKDADKTGAIKVVGFDEEDDTLQGVKDGHIAATVVQQPYEFGYQSVRVLAALARKEEGVIPDNKIIDVPVKVIRSENVDEFWTNLKALRKGGSAAPLEKDDKTVRVAFVTNNASDFWNIAQAGVNKAQAEFNATCDFQMPAEGTAADQQRIVEALIAQGVSGMAISPNDAANQIDMINNACEALNVICHDSDAPKSNRLCYVGTNNYKAGREAGKLIKEVLPDGGELMIFVGRLDAQNAIERRQGILDELSDKPMD